MGRGAVLYRDFWDLKQPGIYDFYFVAGRIGGFTSLSVHVFELVYLLVFSAVLAYANSRWTAFKPAPALVPLFAIGLYFVATSGGDQLQLEGLVGFPLFLCAWFACEGTRATGTERNGWFAAAGLSAGYALVFKLLFAPLFAALYLTALAFPNNAYRPTLRVVAASIGVAILAATLPVAATLATLASGNALGTALETWFVIPPRIVATFPAQHSEVLLMGVNWFARAFAVAIFLALAGTVAGWRTWRLEPLARCCAVWTIVGVVTILAQRTSWWGYQWMLLDVPLGAFAALGLMALLRRPYSAARLAALGVACALMFFPVRTELRKLAALARHGFALRADDRERYRDDVSEAYAGARRDAALLPAGADVYVIGDPVYYVVTDRTQPLVINGWSPQLLLPEQRESLLRELQVRAPQYVYISNVRLARVLMQRSPAFAAYFSRAYHLAARGTAGTLYRRSSRVNVYRLPGWGMRRAPLGDAGKAKA